jgi:hypothetical protein
MLDTLNLSGDLDDVDMLCDVERRFSITVTNAEAAQLYTAGQLHDLIERKYADAGWTRACLSQAAFYRLRRALTAMGVATEISPQTPISVIADLEPQSVVKKWRRLAETAALDLPPLETPFGPWLPEPGTGARRWLNALTPIAMVAMFVCCLVLIRRNTGFSEALSWVLAVVAFLTAIFGVAAVWHALFRTIPRRLMTVGDLAREAAGHSFARLVAEKKGSARSDRWFALAAILRLVSGHKTAITRDTTFYPVNTKPAE